MIDYGKKSTKRTVRKVCARCGEKGWYRERETKCKRRRFGRGSYCCWGELTRVRRRTPDADVLRDANGTPRPLGYYLNEEAQLELQVQRGGKVRADAERKLAHARRMVAEKTKQMKRLVTSLRMWERRATYYAKRATVSDAEVEAERLARLNRPTKNRRALALDGKELR